MFTRAIIIAFITSSLCATSAFALNSSDDIHSSSKKVVEKGQTKHKKKKHHKKKKKSSRAVASKSKSKSSHRLVSKAKAKKANHGKSKVKSVMSEEKGVNSVPLAVSVPVKSDSAILVSAKDKTKPDQKNRRLFNGFFSKNQANTKEQRNSGVGAEFYNVMIGNSVPFAAASADKDDSSTLVPAKSENKSSMQKRRLFHGFFSKNKAKELNQKDKEVALFAPLAIRDVGNDYSKEVVPAINKYNYVKFGGSLVQPTSLGGNSGLTNAPVTYALGISYGRHITDSFSLDLEYSYRGKNIAKLDNPANETEVKWPMESNTVMLNGIYNLTKGMVKPYLKVGGGMSVNAAHTYSEPNPDSTTETFYFPGKTTRNFAWKVGAGVSLAATENISTDIEYSFINRGTIKTQSYFIDGFGDRINSNPQMGYLRDHVVTIGLKLQF
jgi:opacity protein-like surface antigen